MSQGLINAVQSKAQPNVSRRDFLKFSAVLSSTAAGGLLLGIQYAQADSSNSSARDAMQQPYPADQTNTTFAPNAFVEINPAGDVALIMAKVEMGQGVYTSIPMLIAEELEVDLHKVTLQHAPPNDKLYGDAILGAQITGGSTSIRAMWDPMRQAGAVCRTLLIAAAAKVWGVDAAACYAENGVVKHQGSDKSLAYGELATAASKLPVPKEVKLKTPDQFKLIGKPIHRLDTPDKANGLAEFGLDAKIPNMQYAIIATCPVFGGKLKSVDASRALASSDVIKVLKVENAVAVIAKHTWAAKRGLDALTIEWDFGKNSEVTTKDLVDDLKKAANKNGAVATNEGDVEKAFKQANKTFEAAYEQPFLAHATMEPMNCTVHVTKNGCEIWVGTQVPTFAQKTAAAVLDIAPEKVKVHNYLIGGGFGRRLETDNVKIAVSFAKQMNVPIKFIWTREEDIQHDMYRPYYFDTLKAGLDTKGLPVAWSHRIVGSSIMARFAPGSLKDGVDSDAVEVAKEPPYTLPNLYVDYVRQEPRDLPTAFWRGVGATRGTFVVESFIDELAHVSKQDPLQYRLGLLDKTPRLKNVVQITAEKAGWSNAKTKSHGQGVSAMHAFGSFLGTVVDVSINDEREVKVNKVVCVVDCGMVVNPNTVKAQIEGGIVFGLTAVLHDEITLKHGRVEQNNYNDYRMMRINETPVIEVHIVQSAESPGGIGEPGTAAVGAALVNAIFAATGQRIRRLPVGNQLKNG
jgi:isoquinoline 1-oxidoreductase subunit beta